MLRRADLELLVALRLDGRARLIDLSKKTKIPMATCHNRLKKLNENVIQKVVPLLDFSSLSYGAHALIMCEVKNSKAMRKVVSASAFVNACYELSQGVFVVEVFAPKMIEVERLKESVEKASARNIKVRYVVDTILREALFTTKKSKEALFESRGF